MGKAIYILICCVIVSYICLQATIFYRNPMQQLVGIDRRMGGRTAWESNYLVIRVHLETDGVDAREIIMIRARAAARRTRHDPVYRMFRARLLTEFSYEYTDEGTLVFDPEEDQWSDTQMIARTSSTGATSAIAVFGHGFLFCINHQFVDGISALALVGTMMDVPEVAQLRSRSLYVPILSEVYHLPRIVQFLCATTVTRNLPYLPDVTYVSESMSITWLKACKKQAVVSFSSVMAAYVTWRIFNAHPTVTTMRIGLIVGMRGASRFNNYGVVLWNQQRPVSTDDKQQGFLAYIHATNTLIVEAYAGAEMTYTIGNAYNSESAGTNADVLISGLPLSTQREPTISGFPIASTTEFLAHASTPFYVMHLGTKDHSHLSWSIRDGTTTQVPSW
jgi:hypothetical protein